MIALLLSGCSGNQPFIREDVAPDSGSSCAFDGDMPSSADVKALTPDGCGYTLVAGSEGDTLRLLLDVPVFADVLADGAGSATYTLPDDAVRLELEVGCNVNAEWCTDVVEASPDVFYSYEAKTGTVTVSAEADGDEAIATITFEGVEFVEEETDDSLTVDALTWEGVRLYIAELG